MTDVTSRRDALLWHKSAFYWFSLRHRSTYHRSLARQRIAKAKELRGRNSQQRF